MTVFLPADEALRDDELRSIADRLLSTLTLVASPAPVAGQCALAHGTSRHVMFVAARGKVRYFTTIARAAHLAFVGPIPPQRNGRSMMVVPRCGRERCFNPSHLELLDKAGWDRRARA